MSEYNLCGKPNKGCCPKLVVSGLLKKKYAIVDDDGTKIKFKTDELRELCEAIKKLNICNKRCC